MKKRKETRERAGLSCDNQPGVEENNPKEELVRERKATECRVESKMLSPGIVYYTVKLKFPAEICRINSGNR